MRVDEVEVRQTRVGQKALGGRQIEEVVRSVAPQAEKVKALPSFPVMIELKPLPPELARQMRLGISASVNIVVKEAKKTVLVPIVAVARRGQGEAVRVEDNKEVRWLPVTTGLSDREFVQITKGIEVGQVVLY